jgi:signal transduction histidine kinase
MKFKSRETDLATQQVNKSQDVNALVDELFDRLAPINHAVNSLFQRIKTRPLGIESAHESQLIKRLRGCLRGLELRLSELGGNRKIAEPDWEIFSINSIVQRVIDELQIEIDAKSILLKTDIPLEDFVVADEEMIHIGVFYLLLNAISASPEQGEILITATLDNHFWDLEIADSGPGIELTDRNRLSRGQYSDHSTRGFRLTRVSQIANSHGGTISVANCSQGGAAYSLSIPQKNPRVNHSRAA